MSQIAVTISDVKLHLTQTQYCLLIALLQSIPKVFANVPEPDTTSPHLPSPVPTPDDSTRSATGEVNSLVDLRPEIAAQPVPGEPRPWTTIERSRFDYELG